MSDYFEDEKPTAESMAEGVAHLRPLWTASQEKWVKADSFYNLTYPVWEDGKDKRHVVYPPHARAMIDGAVDTILSVDPHIKRLPHGKGQAAEKKANQGIEPGLTAVINDAILKEAEHPIRQLGKNLYLYGYGVLGALYDDAPIPQPKRRRREAEVDYRERVEKWEQHRDGWNPISIKAPHPSRVLMDPRDMNPSECYLLGTRYAKDLYALIKDKARYRGKYARAYEVESNPWRPVEVVERWSPNWHSMMEKNGELLFVEPAIFGIQPFKHSYSGLGGEQTNTESNASQLAVGLLEPLYDTLRAMTMDKSGKLNALLETAYARPGTTQPPEEAAQALAKKQGVLGGKKEDWWFLEYPPLQQWMTQMGEMLERDYTIGSYPRSAVGERQAGVTTVGQEMLLQQAVDKKFYMVSKRIEQLLCWVGSTILQYVDISEDTITIGGKSLKPTDIQGDYSIYITLPLENPAIEMEQTKLDMSAAEGGFISKQTVREAHWTENEEEESDRLLTQLMESLEPVQLEMMDTTLRTKGFAKIADRLRERQAMQKQQAAMQGQPGMPPGQPPMTGGQGNAGTQ